MNHRYRRVVVVLFILVCVAALVWYMSRPSPIEVVVAPVGRGDVESTVANTRAGTVKACRRAGLSPATGGQIAQLPVHEGARVGQGQLLMALWNDDLRAQVALAGSEAQAAMARAEAACLQAEVDEREAQRLLRLQPSSAVSEEQVDLAVTKAKANRASCAAARASTQVSQAQLGVAKAQLARTILEAPFAGVVAEINGELNEYVTPSPPGIATLPAIDLIDDSCFYITAPIDEVDAPAITPGMAARITLDAFPGRHFAGKVRRVADFVLEREKQARTVDVDVEFVDPQEADTLLAGYSADAEVILSRHRGVLRIPTVAVMEGPAVLVYDAADRRLEARAIEIGTANWDWSEIRSGVDEGESVVTSLDRAGVAAGAYAVVERDSP